MKLENVEVKIPEKEIVLGTEKVKVKQYLPAREKSDMLLAVHEFCFNTQLLDQPKTDAIFNSLIVLNYTDIEYESRDEDDLLLLYDYLEINDYVAKVIDAIPEIEYNALIGYYRSTINDFNKFKVSSIAAFAQVVELVPELMEKVSEISKEIDLEAIKTVTGIYSKMN